MLAERIYARYTALRCFLTALGVDTETADTDACRLEHDISEETADALNRFLGTLKPDHRKIFVQRYWYLCPVDEIAENLELTKSKVTVTLMRTRKKLEAFLKEEGYL